MLLEKITAFIFTSFVGIKESPSSLCFCLCMCIYRGLCRLGRVKLLGVRKDINSWKDFDTPLFPTPSTQACQNVMVSFRPA